jgi:hypothetical protein
MDAGARKTTGDFQDTKEPTSNSSRHLRCVSRLNWSMFLVASIFSEKPVTLRMTRLESAVNACMSFQDVLGMFSCMHENKALETHALAVPQYIMREK